MRSDKNSLHNSVVGFAFIFSDKKFPSGCIDQRTGGDEHFAPAATIVDPASRNPLGYLEFSTSDDEDRRATLAAQYREFFRRGKHQRPVYLMGTSVLNSMHPRIWQLAAEEQWLPLSRDEFPSFDVLRSHAESLATPSERQMRARKPSAVQQWIAHFEDRELDIHGRAVGKSGACHLIASYRDTWDAGDKEARVFFAARVDDWDADPVRFKFSVSGSALASDRVLDQIGDPEKFLLEAGLTKFRRLLAEDDSPGLEKEFMMSTRSAAHEFELFDPAEIRAEIARVKRAVLDALWRAKQRGLPLVKIDLLLDASCTMLPPFQSSLERLCHEGLAVQSGQQVRITPAGETAAESVMEAPAGAGAKHAVPIGGDPKHEYDVFISYAREDEIEFVEPLAQALRAAGVGVWYDRFKLSWGMSLRQSIDEGLRSARFGIVVLSPHFFAKEWPQLELDAMWGTMTKDNRLLPIRHGLSTAELEWHSPLLSGILNRSSEHGVEAVVEEFLQLLRP